jgi:hypothetical protein
MIKQFLLSTFTSLLLFQGVAQAQSGGGFPFPGKTVVVENLARYGGIHQWDLYNHLSKPVTVRVVIDRSYSINGKSYKPSQPAHIVLPPQAYTPIKINMPEVGKIPIWVQVELYQPKTGGK